MNARPREAASDLNRDELDRQLAAADHDHRASMGPWRELLARVFDPSSTVDERAKAELVGVPSRRGFMKIGGISVLGAAVLAACGADDAGTPGAGPRKPTTTAPPTTGASGADLDVVLLRTASSLEVLAVDVYQKAIDSGAVTTPAVVAAATRFQGHHRDHAAALQAATEANGGTPYDDANPAVMKMIVEPALPRLTDELAIVKFACTLEHVAASTYAFAAGALSIPELRQTIMTIGGVEARHATVLQSVIAASDPGTWVPEPFTSTEPNDGGPDGRIPDEALIPT